MAEAGKKPVSALNRLWIALPGSPGAWLLVPVLRSANALQLLLRQQLAPLLQMSRLETFSIHTRRRRKRRVRRSHLGRQSLYTGTACLFVGAATGRCASSRCIYYCTAVKSRGSKQGGRSKK